MHIAHNYIHKYNNLNIELEMNQYYQDRIIDDNIKNRENRSTQTNMLYSVDNHAKFPKVLDAFLIA